MFMAVVIVCGLQGSPHADQKFLTEGCGLSNHKKLFSTEESCQKGLVSMMDFYKKLPPNAYVEDASCVKVSEHPNT